MDPTQKNRMKTLILYVAERCGSYDRFGKIKLNKTLFFADMNAYLATGKTLTGALYVKEQFGPVPANIESMIDELERDGLATVEMRRMPDLKVQHRVVPRRGPNLEIFTFDELKFVEDALDLVRDESAHDISEWTHQLPGWRVARMGEEIPAFMALLPHRPERLNERELQHGREVARSICEAN